MKRISYDYLIVGQGLAGSILSYRLLQENKNVLVIDAGESGTSSRVAAGLFNPITGRRVVKSWMADTILPFAADFYRSIEKEWNKNFFHPCDVVEIVRNVKDQNEWSARMEDPGMKKYLDAVVPEHAFAGKIDGVKKMFRITSSGWLDLPCLLETWKEKLIEINALLPERFSFERLNLRKEPVEYGDIISKKIIFCEGPKAQKNPLWAWLPFVPAKGEILTIHCDALPQDFILLSGLFLIPLGDHRFRVGATFEWNYPDENPTGEGMQKIVSQLNSLLLVPFEVIDHRAGIRPTVKDRRPLLGRHPLHRQAYIFNGLGTKGVQLAPYLGDHFIRYLEEDQPLMREVDITRFPI